MIEQQMAEPQFDFIRAPDKDFIIGFTNAMEGLGYTYGDEVGSGYCWGRYMLVFRKAGPESQTTVARIYIRKDSIVLRLFLNRVTRHADYISASPEHIRSAFTSDYGTCRHCKGHHCQFRKDYNIDGVRYEKCNGTTFEFHHPKAEHLPDYIALFREF